MHAKLLKNSLAVNQRHNKVSQHFTSGLLIPNIAIDMFI